VNFDKKFWEILYDKLKHFYFCYLLPEIVEVTKDTDKPYICFDDQDIEEILKTTL
jgi:hypothetical protein